MKTPHISVLLDEVCQIFAGMALKSFIDGTLGAGGHTEAILRAHPECKQVWGFDQDPAALRLAKDRLSSWDVTYIHSNFAHLEKADAAGVDGILLDLGVSSMQFDQPEKGFSFMREGPLDMRMDPSNPLTAEEIVNDWPEERIGWIFRDYGEEKFWRKAAKAIAMRRKNGRIKTTKELASLLEIALPYKKKGIHPVTQVFQALRICVNNELEVLEEVIPKAIKLLNQRGRLVVISFHSLEDRIVKNAFRHAASDKWNTSGIGGVFLDKIPEVKLLTRKPVTPSISEMERNPRSRSASLRAIEKL
jgi:16S rRNA (cytosine1402-N4)-methyltransferase